MAETIGLIASIAQLAELSQKVFKFVDSLRSASKDQKDLSRELNAFVPILLRLLDKTNDARRQSLDQQWLDAMRWFKPVLDELVSTLGRMIDRLPLQSDSKLKTFADKVGWVLTQEKCKEVLSRIERLKTTLLVALNENTS